MTFTYFDGSFGFKVHPATNEMLMRYPKHELEQYAQSLGLVVEPSMSKSVIVELLLTKNPTVCASLGD